MTKNSFVEEVTFNSQKKNINIFWYFNACVKLTFSNMKESRQKLFTWYDKRKKKRFFDSRRRRLLAMAIQRYSCLNYKSHRSYKEKNVVQKAWEAVANASDFTEDGKNFFCHFRWNFTHFSLMFLLNTWNSKFLSLVSTLLTFAIAR